MPTSFLSADAGFPRLTNDIPMEERMNRVQQYLFMLLEQLRYALANLSEDNFNEAALAEMEENMTSGLRSVVTDLAGNVSTLEQTAEGLTATVSDIEGNVATLAITAESITSRINNVDGQGSTIEQTASALNFAVFDPTGDVSLVSQKADRIDWIVASGGSASTFTLTSRMADLVADEISITGVVTFNDLETAGHSVINGDNIELKADSDGDSVSYLTYTSANDSTFAQLHTRDNTTGTTSDRDRYAFVIETPGTVDGDYCAMKLEAGDSMSLEAGHLLYMEAASQIILNNGWMPTRIQAANVYYSQASVPADCYAFCSDGIYYGSTRILAI